MRKYALFFLYLVTFVETAEMINYLIESAKMIELSRKQNSQRQLVPRNHQN